MAPGSVCSSFSFTGIELRLAIIEAGQGNSMKLIKQMDGIYSIELDDVFDFKTVERFRRTYEQIDTAQVKTVHIDFKNTRYIDSSALGMLLHIRRYFKSDKVGIKIRSPNTQIRKILSISRFDQKFAIE